MFNLIVVLLYYYYYYYYYYYCCCCCCYYYYYYYYYYCYCSYYSSYCIVTIIYIVFSSITHSQSTELCMAECTHTRHCNLASLRDLQQDCSRTALCKAEETKIDGIALTCLMTHPMTYPMTHVVAKQLVVGVSEQFQTAASCMDKQRSNSRVMHG